MKTKDKKILSWPLGLALVVPLALIGLFYLARTRRSLVDFWVFSVLRPVAQGMGRLWSVLPFSVMEVMLATCILGSVIWLIWALVRLKQGKSTLLRRILALGAVWLWLWCGLCWLWNVTYYASSFSQRSGLGREPHSVEELAAATEYFAFCAARLSKEVPRDEEGHFAQSWQECIRQGPEVYDNIEKLFPVLAATSVKTKPLVCSRLQSILGFTGMYFPFTGEANVNIDAPTCLLPATIAHEMAHQRLVASELEANFVGIAASVTSENVVFRYSGYLMGLMELSSALSAVSPEGWKVISKEYFTAELVTDWNDNHYYWAALESPVEEMAEQTYDSFLKGNGQALGMQSYGACVDLLVTWFIQLSEG